MPPTQSINEQSFTTEGVGLMSPYPIRDWLLACLVLCRASAGSHFYCVIMMTMPLSCSKVAFHSSVLFWYQWRSPYPWKQCKSLVSKRQSWTSKWHYDLPSAILFLPRLLPDSGYQQSRGGCYSWINEDNQGLSLGEEPYSGDYTLWQLTLQLTIWSCVRIR